MANILEVVRGAVTPKTARQKIEAEIHKANADVARARGERQRLAHIAFTEPSPEAEKALAAADRATAAAERRLQVAQEALAEQDLVEARDATAAQIKAETQIDATTRCHIDLVIDCATQLQEAIARYVDLYEQTVVAEKLLAEDLALNPRARKDIHGVSIAQLVTEELARVSHLAGSDNKPGGFVPGACVTRTYTEYDRTKWTPLADGVRELLNAAGAGLRSDASKTKAA